MYGHSVYFAYIFVIQIVALSLFMLLCLPCLFCSRNQKQMHCSCITKSYNFLAMNTILILILICVTLVQNDRGMTTVTRNLSSA